MTFTKQRSWVPTFLKRPLFTYIYIYLLFSVFNQIIRIIIEINQPHKDTPSFLLPQHNQSREANDRVYN